jgi:hypothetical protein
MLTSILPASAILTGEIPPPTDYVTMTGLMDAVSNGPQSHAVRRGRGGRVPVWALACVMLGTVLIGLSLAAPSIAQLLYLIIH